MDGLFFNLFGNQSTDYSGNYVGLCHRDSCSAKFESSTTGTYPKLPTVSTGSFSSRDSREVSDAIGKLIRDKRPKAGYFNYMQEYTDGIMSESNTAVKRPLPLWPYSASDNVNRARNSQPGKMSIDSTCNSSITHGASRQRRGMKSPCECGRTSLREER